MLLCKPCDTPIATKSKQISQNQPYQDPTFYRRVVGALQYLTITWPNLASAVNIVCQAMHMPQQSHFLDVKRILHYLSGTVDYSLHYTHGCLRLIAFSDVDWAGDPAD